MSPYSSVDCSGCHSVPDAVGVAALILADRRGAQRNRRFRKRRSGIPSEGRGGLKKCLFGDGS